ncbi:BofC C-terminal domain-containing protein [Paenibacillus sp. P26]|nr:BofC C-terminal domain-containing protein [Paenibacillus sp. P26]
MMLHSFWNQLKRQLKKKLRLRRRWLNLAAVLLVIGAAAVCVWLYRQESGLSGGEKRQDEMVFARHTGTRLQPEEEVVSLLKGMEGRREGYTKKAYVCGEEMQWIGTMSASDILAYYRSNPNLIVSLGEDGKVYFTEKIDDLSPQCKTNAYFGLDANGNLSLFEGAPGASGSSVIRTFFQLNIQHLESDLPRETVKRLYSGIRVRDLQDYNSVLSTLSDFAVEETEKVMQSAPH